MEGLAGYGSSSDSDSEQEKQQQQIQGPAKSLAEGQRQQAAAPPPPPASGLPSAAELLGGGAPGRLPAPEFGGQSTGRQQHGGTVAAAGSKRGHPDVRGPLPNPLTDSKVARSGTALNVGGAKAATTTGGMLVPPQLRGRANVATDDLSCFTTQSQQAAARRSSGGAKPS